MPYTLRYHPAVAEDDIPDIPANLRQRVARSLEARLTTSPARYGTPLKGSLKGYWKLRVGDYRVVFRIVGSEVWVLTILHRRAAYEALMTRLGWHARWVGGKPRGARRPPRIKGPSVARAVIEGRR